MTRAKLARGTIERIEATLDAASGETVSGFIRTAILRELRRRRKHAAVTVAGTREDASDDET
ncbi:MAG TPA: hypothetical protein VGR63_15335 [Casimicrobiaceae bacterium]|jgi:hypothetical protein|nr:hypothetical protein [Casimicrobiaceae bacterium]